jgi:hypothetical protein
MIGRQGKSRPGAAGRHQLAELVRLQRQHRQPEYVAIPGDCGVKIAYLDCDHHDLDGLHGVIHLAPSERVRLSWLG